MDAVFSRLMEVSGEGSVIVLAVLALRLVLRRAPRRTVCLLWMLAVLRLLVPFKIESDWSLQPEQEVFTPPVVQEDYFDSGTAQTPIIPEYLENAVEYPLDQPTVPEKVTVADILPWLWLLGAGLLAVHGAVSYVRLKGRIRDAVVLEEGVWLCPGLDTAFVLGFFRPQIYLPVLDEEERELVLRHERCHIRRLDHWWKLAAYAAVSIHWFNPLAWVTYVLLCRDMELACDQDTVRGMDNAQRRAYSAALLNCAARRSGIAACPVAFGEISVKERIKMVLHYRKPGFWVTLVALVATVAVGVCLLTSPKELTDLEKCQQALENWQGMEAYELQVSNSSVGDFVETDWTQSTYFALDGEYLMKYVYGDGLGHWRHWKDGKGYHYEFGSLDAEWVDSGWKEDSFDKSAVVHWSMELQWDDLVVQHKESLDDGKTIILTVEQSGWGTGTMSFFFDDDGTLWSISRTYTLGNDDGLSSVCTSTVEMKDREREWIEKTFEEFGVAPALICLYRELDALQAGEFVHLVVETVKSNVFGGWDNRHQEFLKWGNNWYWDVDMLSDYGTIENSYLWYGQKMYEWAHSNTDGAPQHPWQESEARYDVPQLLTKDWRALPLLEIRQEDGYTIVTLEGDPSNTERMTYYSLTYVFYLDRNGKLNKLVAHHHVSEFVESVGPVETQATTTTTFPDTSDQQIQKRITEIWADVKTELR